MVKLSLKQYFIENRENIKNYLLNVREVGWGRVRDYQNAIDKYLPSNIYNTKDLKKHLEKIRNDTYLKGLKNIFNFMEYEELDTFNNQPLDAWRKSIKIKASRVREIYISDEEIKEAREHISDKLLFDILVYSGMRLAQVVKGLKNIDNAVYYNTFFRIPIASVSSGHKKAFWLYLPLSLKDQLKNNNFAYYPKNVQYKRVSANTIRKWNLNKLLELDVPMDTINFIQGRAATNVGSLHYMDATRSADREYERIVNRLIEI